MKGDATTRTTSKKYRDGYDAIDWCKGGKVVHVVIQGARVDPQVVVQGRPPKRVGS